MLAYEGMAGLAIYPVEEVRVGMPAALFTVGLVEVCAGSAIGLVGHQFAHPSSAVQMMVALARKRGGDSVLQTGQGLPAPPQQPSPSPHETCGWFSQTHPVLSQFLHLGWSVIPLPSLVSGWRP